MIGQKQTSDIFLEFTRNLEGEAPRNERVPLVPAWHPDGETHKDRSPSSECKYRGATGGCRESTEEWEEDTVPVSVLISQERRHPAPPQGTQNSPGRVTHLDDPHSELLPGLEEISLEPAVGHSLSDHIEGKARRGYSRTGHLPIPEMRREEHDPFLLIGGLSNRVEVHESDSIPDLGWRPPGHAKQHRRLTAEVLVAPTRHPPTPGWRLIRKDEVQMFINLLPAKPEEASNQQTRERPRPDCHPLRENRQHRSCESVGTVLDSVTQRHLSHGVAAPESSSN